MDATRAAARPRTKASATQRPFRVLDATILTAATAVGCRLQLCLARLTDGDISWRGLYQDGLAMLHPTDNGNFGFKSIYMFSVLISLLLPYAMMWTIALLLIQIHSPRSTMRRLTNQPGAMVGFASGISLVMIGLQITGRTLISGAEATSAQRAVQDAVIFSPMFVGLSVLVSWMTLLLGARWRARATWIDRCGRLLGLFWIIAGLVMAGLVVMEPM